MTDYTALSRFRLVPAQTVPVGAQVVCAMPEFNESDTPLAAAFDYSLESGNVVVDHTVIDNPRRCGYTRAEVGVRLLASVSHAATEDGFTHLVLGGGSDLRLAVRVAPQSRVRVLEAPR